MKLLHSPFFRFAVTGSRFFLGLVFFTAGVGKLMPFPGLIGPVWLEEALEPHGLALYARFIAYSQIVVGALLLSVRFATIGAIMLVPLLLNIFMVTVSLQWQGTPYVVAVMIAMNVLLLIADFDRLKFLLTDDPEALRPLRLSRRRPRTDLFWGLGMLAMIIAPVVWSWISGLAYVLIGLGLAIFTGCEMDRRRQHKFGQGH